jgi:single-strand DNA-binding protein
LFTATGRATSTFGLAFNRRYQNPGTQDWAEEVSDLNIVLWGALAQNAAESSVKSSRVVVTGRLAQRTFETTDGEKRSIVELAADEIGASVRWATVAITKAERKELPNESPAAEPEQDTVEFVETAM